MNQRPLISALLRVLAIAAATAFVGITVVALVFLSTGGQSQVLPPWPVVLAEVICVTMLLLLSHRSMKFRSGSSIFKAATAFSAVLTIAVVSYFGYEHTWNLASVIGQTVALFLMLAYPIFISAGVIIMMRKRSASLIHTWSISIVLCLLLTVPMVFVGMLFACATGDCL